MRPDAAVTDPVPGLAVFGSKTTTAELLSFLRHRGSRPSLLVHLTPPDGERHQVAGYTDLRATAEADGTQVYHPTTYALTDPADQEFLTTAGIRVALVMGWQRLVPAPVLDSLAVGAFGMHGSSEPLPRGRGRSPLNWSLLEHRSTFRTNLFRYDPGVDSGDVVGTVVFDINAWDDCHSLHLKNTLAMIQLLDRHLDDLLAGRVDAHPQLTDVEPTYYPKRTPEDGRIRWLDMDVTRLHDHVRAQTRPFAGAFSHYEGGPEPVRFWHAVPFDTRLEFPPSAPGRVCATFDDGTFLVSTWDGTVRVLDAELPPGTVLAVGGRFTDEPA